MGWNCTGAWRIEAGLERARLALAGDFFSLLMIHVTQGWSGGVKSWWLLIVVNLESDRMEPWNSAFLKA